MMDAVRRLWAVVRAIPRDAVEIMGRAALIPVLMTVWMVAPTQDWRRGVFAVCLALVAILGSCAVERGDRAKLGAGLSAVAIALCLHSLGTLVVLRANGVSDEIVTISWRLSSTAQQAWMVVAWAVLERIQTRWLNRSVLRGVVAVLAAGFLWNVYTSFTVPDPLVTDAGLIAWTDMARSVGARSVPGGHLIEAALRLSMWAWVVWAAVYWIVRQKQNGNGGR